MKIPMSPKPLQLLLERALENLLKLAPHASATDAHGRYLHWDKLRHLKPPKELTTEEWWAATKLVRVVGAKRTGFLEKSGVEMTFFITDPMARQLHELDKKVAGTVAGFLSSPNHATAKDFRIKALFDEAITSSQLEGASTTRQVAKAMLAEKRKPADRSQRMIHNNYRALEFIKENRDEPVTSRMILELHRIVTEETLDDPAKAGDFRKEGDSVSVWDSSDGTLMHEPPKASTLDERVEKLCSFINEKGDGKRFIHPLVRGIIAHYMLAYDHPFWDGNGRTARALFYWVALKNGYWLVEFLSLSAEIMRARRQYDRSFAYSETDGGDITYFIESQLNFLMKAVEKFYANLEERASEREAIDKKLASLAVSLNDRQKALLADAMSNQGKLYSIEGHQGNHGIAYATARGDLIGLRLLGLLKMEKVGKRMIFSPVK